MNGAGAGDGMKREADESDEQRALKQMRTDTGASSLAQTMFAGQPMQENLFSMGSQAMEMPPPSMMGLMASIPAAQTQQRQQYAAAMAARHAQQQHAAMAAMMTSQSSANPMQMNANAAPNMHMASLMASQGMAFPMPQTQLSSASAAAPQQQQQSGVSTVGVTPAMLQGNATATPAAADTPCLICGEKGDLFTCNGGCGLHAHRACLGEDAIFPFVVGQICGSCSIMQQNRVAPEDLTKGGANALSIRRAILSANLETINPSNFNQVGHLASLRLCEIGAIAGYPIKPFAEKFIEPYLQRWIREKLLSVDKWMMNVREIFTVLIGLYSLKRACIAHGMGEKVVELIEARKFTVTDFFGWHPAIEGPNVRCSHLCAICGIRNPPELDLCSRCHHKLAFPSIFSKYSGSILAAYYSEQVGIQLGATTLDVFSHTNAVRGMYKGLRPFDADGLLWDQFVDQLRMIFALLDVMSDFGTLQLNPDLFAPEVNIIFNAGYVNQSILTNEFEVVGKFLQCMKLFGHAKSEENLNMISACERFLLIKQLPNGGWGKGGRGMVDQYKSTVTCAKALLTPNFRGYGPVSHECHRLLEKWARGSNPKLPSGAKQAGDGAKLKLLASGATVKPNAQAKLKRLEAMYKKQTAPEGGNSSLEDIMADRMKKLLRAKKREDDQAIKTENKDIANEVSALMKQEPRQVNGEEDAAKDQAKTEETAAGGATDSEDSKLEHHTATQSGELPAGQDGSIVPAETTMRDDEDDTLTNMSLHEDLEIFDGLQFEDGGGIIDISFQSLGAHGEADNDVDADDGDGTDAPGQEDDDETMGDNVYDDDQDENEDASSYDVLQPTEAQADMQPPAGEFHQA